MSNLLKRPDNIRRFQQINYTRRNIQMAKNYENDMKTVNNSSDKASRNAMDSQNCGKNSSKNSSKNSYSSKNSSKNKASSAYDQDSYSDRY